MIKLIYLSAVVSLLCPLPAFPAQGNSQARQAEHSLVLSIAEKTIDAIRTKDTEFLGRLADREGVTIGVDAPKMCAARFKKELTKKRGVYCVIFDASCLKKTADKSRMLSLREALGRQPVRMNISEIEGASNAMAVVVKKTGKPEEVLFTLIYRKANGNWMLQQIEYW